MATRQSRPSVANAEPAQDISAGDLKSTSSIAQPTVSSLTFEDREAARLAGVEQGLAERRTLDIEEQVQARLHQLPLEALNMAQRHAAATGPAWAALIAWAGEDR